jgi:DNA-binding MarR family transcriptional regulator
MYLLPAGYPWSMASVRQAIPTLSDAEAHAWFGFLLAHAALARQVDADLLDAHRLTASAHEVLYRLVRAPDGQLSVSALAENVVISPSRVSRVVDDLVGRGLIERRTCKSDARISYATITDEGRREAAEVEETFHAALRRRFLSRLDDEDVERLAAIWEKLGFGAPPACETA